MTDRAKTMLDKTEQILNDNPMFAEICNVGETLIAVEITWGDWKHEHLRFKYLMKEAGFEHVAEKITEEDGGDAYSAIHVFRLVEEA